MGTNVVKLVPLGSWWRFSLREVLLLMVAIGACLALARKEYYSRRPSPFSEKCKLIPLVKEVAMKHEIGGPRAHWSTGFGGGSSCGGVSEYEYTVNLAPEAEIKNTFRDALRKELVERLVRSGCTITGRGYGGGSTFRLQYEYFNNVGSVRVKIHDNDVGAISRVEISCFEVSRMTK